MSINALRLLLALAFAGVAPYSLRAEEPAKPTAAAPAGGEGSATYEVQAVRNVVYRDLCPGEDATKGKNKLDLFLPRGRQGYPVVYFVHGGGWRSGDKDYAFGVYSNLGMYLARHGIGAVVTNYRLSPAVQHPEHIKDVAQGFAWTYKHVAEYGGRPDQIFVCGHSAGGHLVALLATDEQYLKAVGLSRSAIRGAIPISGVYDVTPPAVGLYENAFGKDSRVRKEASPICHACADAPPFLILYADKDFLTCDKVSEAFCQALREKKCEAQTLEVKDRNHFSILIGLTKPTDPGIQALLGFVSTHSGKPMTAAGGQ